MIPRDMTCLPPSDQKSEMRRIFREYRRLLEPAHRRQASSAIHDRLMSWKPLVKARCVMTYLSFGEEVETFPLVRRLLAGGKSVAVPYIHQGAINLIASKINNLEHDLQVGPLGILEPRPDRLRPLDPKVIDLQLVPGVVFDEVGFRIGYGKGYYDRFLLLRSPRTIVAGLAFDLQIVEQVPREVWDIPMDFVVTEKRLIDCSTARFQLTGQLGLFQQTRPI